MPPFLALIGFAGAVTAANLATIALAGLAFGVVVLAATSFAVWGRRRELGATATCAYDGPVEVSIGA